MTPLDIFFATLAALAVLALVPLVRRFLRWWNEDRDRSAEDDADGGSSL